MQNIGLMMTYNEEDIIAEVMEANKKFFEQILVLDGSSDGTEEILRSFDNVKFILKDQEIFPRRRIRDGARQFLLEKAQELYGTEGWFTLLHGDEIFVDDPNQIAAQAEACGAERVNWHALNFFLHTSQIPLGFDRNKSIQEQVLYYHPGNLEIRQFKNKPGIHYNLNQHGNVLPAGINWKFLMDYPIFKHYVVRTPWQRAHGTGFTGATEIIKYDQIRKDAYRDNLGGNYKQLRCYDGSFHEMAPGARPSFFKQWVAWKDYRKINWGVVTPLIPKRYR